MRQFPSLSSECNSNRDSVLSYTSVRSNSSYLGSDEMGSGECVPEAHIYYMYIYIYKRLSNIREHIRPCIGVALLVVLSWMRCWKNGFVKAPN